MTDIAPTSSTGSSSWTAGTTQFDRAKLVEAGYQAKLQPADRIDAQIADNERQVAAYREMEDALLRLRDSAEALRSPPGVTSVGVDAFAGRATYLSSSDGSDPETLLGVAVEPDAPTGSHTVEVRQTAAAHKVASAAQSDDTAALGQNGTFSLGTAGQAADIVVTADMSLADIADAINGVSATTGVTASILDVSATEHVLVLSATETGTPIEASAVSGDDVLGNLGLTAAGSFVNELQPPREAVVAIDGIEVRRPTNQIDDAVDGMTIDLYGARPGTEITVEVGDDLGGIKQAVLDLVEAYNAFRDIALTHQQPPADSQVEAPALFGDGMLRSVSTGLADIVNWRLPDGDGLGSVGITMTEGGKLEVDEAKLDNALLTDLESVRGILAFDMHASSPNLELLMRPQWPPTEPFTLNVTTDGAGTVIGADIDGDAGAVTVDGNVIRGAEGSVYEGLEFLYTGSGSASIEVELSQGIADRLYAASSTMADPYNGRLADTVGDIEAENEQMRRQADRIRSDAEEYRRYLNDYYARLEAKLAEANLLKEQLKAILDADDD